MSLARVGEMKIYSVGESGALVSIGDDSVLPKDVSHALRRGERLTYCLTDAMDGFDGGSVTFEPTLIYQDGKLHECGSVIRDAREAQAFAEYYERYTELTPCRSQP
ncbi:hypothetical protein KAM345_015480 [Aeromonas caviae]|nr:hypothetical protein KAM345_015480 [Aeromonas caviae]